MSVLSYSTTITLGPNGPGALVSDHFDIQSYSKIGVMVPKGIDLAVVVIEYDDWISPESDIELVEEFLEWENVPILLNEFGSDPIKVKVQPSATDNVNGIIIASDNYSEIFYTVDDGFDVFWLSASLILIGPGNVGLLGNSAKDFTFYNLGHQDANITILVARNAIE